MPQTDAPRTSRAPVPAPIRLIKRTLMVLAGPFYFLWIAFVPLICGKRRGFRGWYWRRVKRACSHMLWFLSVRVQMSTADRQALAEDTDSIIVINHRSNLDGFAIMDAIPDAKWFTWAGKKELFDTKLLRTGFHAAGLVEIDRKNGKLALETLETAVHAMPARRSVVMFPEGTRTDEAKRDGDVLGPFKAGAVVVARNTGRVIRPVVILDSDTLLPRGAFWPRAGTIHVKTLPAFHCDPTGDVDADVARLRAVMRDAFSADDIT